MYIVNIIFQNILYKESLKVNSKKKNNNSKMFKDLKQISYKRIYPYRKQSYEKMALYNYQNS